MRRDLSLEKGHLPEKRGEQMDSGYIKLFRCIQWNELWEDKPFSRGQAWIDMVMLANHRDGHIRVRGNKLDVKRGQVGWSKESLASRWGWSRGKVIRFLDELETEQQIVQQKNNVTSLITITNYDKYQSSDTTDGTTNGQQTDTNNKGKNKKKESSHSVEKIISHLNSKVGARFSPRTKPTIESVNARLSEGWTIQDFFAAIDNQVRDWKGTDMEKYLTPDTLFRPSKFEKYVNNVCKEKPNGGLVL